MCDSSSDDESFNGVLARRGITDQITALAIESDGEDDDIFENIPEEEEEVETEKNIQWQETIPRKRRGAKDTIERRPGPTLKCAEAETPLNYFKLFFCDKMIDLIIKYSNMHELKGDYELTHTDLNAVLGLFILAGVTHQNMTDVDDLWAEDDDLRIRIFGETIGRQHFQKIVRILRFDDKMTRDERKKKDKLAPIREFSDLFLNHCIENFNPEFCLTVDERMSPYKGRCGFRQYMPKKPKRYGIKLWILAGVESHYVHNFQVYLGLQEKREVKQPKRVVLDMVKHIRKGHNITVDQYFSSVELAHELLSKGITMLGTIQSNRKSLPESMRVKKGEKYAHAFMFSDHLQLTRYHPNEKRSVLILSSSHPDIQVDDGVKRKPQTLLWYNETKAGVDIVDHLIAKFTCQRKTRRWPLNLFFNFLDMILINAYAVYAHGKGDNAMSRKKFLILIGKSLVEDLKNHRKKKKMKGRETKPSSSTSAASSSARPNKGVKCDICHKKDNTRFCINCPKVACPDHIHHICSECKSE